MCFSFRTLAALCTVAVSLNTTGCASRDVVSQVGSGSSPLLDVGGDNGAEPEVLPEPPDEQDFAPAENADCTITFAEDSIGIRGSGVQVQGSTAVISESGVYRISGESDSGRVVIEGGGEVALILDGVQLQSSGGAVLESSAASLTVTLAESRQNSILSADGSGIATDGDLIINGSGSLYISSQADNAIDSAGAVMLCGGSLDISADRNGILSGRQITAAAGCTTISSKGDGMKVTYTGGGNAGYISVTDGVLDITSANDAIQAENAVFVSGGSVTLSSGGGSTAVVLYDAGGKYLRGKHGGYSTDGGEEFDFSNLVSGDGSTISSKKGIKSGGVIEISGGEVVISSADDSLYAKRGVRLSDGEVRISAGDDAIHCGGSIMVSGGGLEIRDSHNCIEGMLVEISGGELLLNARRSGIVAAGGTELSGSGSDHTGRYVSISGGRVSLNAGGSGINSGGTITLSGGEVSVSSGDGEFFGSVDYRDSFALSGGVFAAFGSDGATKAPCVLSQPCISVLGDFVQGSTVELADSAGTLIYSVIVPFTSSTFMFSSDDIIAGVEYSVFENSVLKKKFTATDGLFGDGPDGRDTGIFDNIGVNSGSSDVAAA